MKIAVTLEKITSDEFLCKKRTYFEGIFLLASEKGNVLFLFFFWDQYKVN